MNFCLYPFVFFTPDRWNVRVARRNVRNIRSLFVSRSLVFSFQRKIVNVCFPVDGHKYGKEVADTVRRNFYVGDLLKSCVTTENATKMALKLIYLLAEGDFRLTKFLSSCKEVLKSIPVEKRATPYLDLDLDHLPINRALSLGWDAEEDEFFFSSIQTDKPLTKRGILSVVSSLFDPLGFLAPFILPVTVLLQDLRGKKLDWNDEISEKEIEIRQSWLLSLHQLSEIRVKRWYGPTKTSDTIELHVFRDASEVAYAASAYLRIINDEGDVHCSFIMGKCRNSPIRRPTIPRLGLMASVTAVRLSNSMTAIAGLDWKVNSVIFWTDSTTVLQYIYNKNRRFHHIVASHLEKIHQYSKPNQWRLVPGQLDQSS